MPIGLHEGARRLDEILEGSPILKISRPWLIGEIMILVIRLFQLRTNLRALVIVKTKTTTALKAISPEAVHLKVGLRHAAVCEQEPGTKDWLGKDVENSIGNDLLVDAENSSTIGDTPDDWVDEPDDDGVGRDGAVELAKIGAFGASLGTTIENKVPDDDEEGNAGNGIPTPALWVVLRAVGSEQASQDHDDISSNSHDDVAAACASKEEQVKQQERSGQAPINVACVVDLAVDVLVCVRDVLVVLGVVDVVVVDAVAGGHGEV